MDTERKQRKPGVAVYLSAVERRTIRVAAAHAGQSMSEYLREAALAAAARAPRPITLVDEAPTAA